MIAPLPLILCYLISLLYTDGTTNLVSRMIHAVSASLFDWLVLTRHSDLIVAEVVELPSFFPSQERLEAEIQAAISSQCVSVALGKGYLQYHRLILSTSKHFWDRD